MVSVLLPHPDHDTLCVLGPHSIAFQRRRALHRLLRAYLAVSRVESWLLRPDEMRHVDFNQASVRSAAKSSALEA
jgi:hypothetical protein